MKNKRAYFFIFLFICVISDAQFYNGHRMSFGKNRVQYNNSIWSFYRYNRYDIYYHQDGDKVAQYVNLVAESEINRVEEILDYQLEKRIIFVVYNSMSDFRQSNIGLISGNDESNIGGITRLSTNTVALFQEGDQRKIEMQISESVTELLIKEILYGTGLGENFTSSALINVPDWFSKGLQAYIAGRWDYETENYVFDGIVTGRYEKFNHLTGRDALCAGHSFWRYIAKTYGEAIIPNIVYLTKINKNVGTAFLYSLGASLKELTYDWQGYYLAQYDDIQKKSYLPDTGYIVKRPRKQRVYMQSRISPDGNLIAFTTNESGRYKIWLYNKSKRKAKKIYKHGHRLDQLTDYSYPIISWHPSGKALTFFIEEKGKIMLYYYTPESKEITTRRFLYFDKIIDYSFSPDGLKIVFSAIKNGKTDIYLFTLASGTYEQITNDFADDRFPRFANGQKYIVFSSNRYSDTLVVDHEVKRYDKGMNIFLFDLTSHSPVMKRIGSKNDVNFHQAIGYASDNFALISDETGIRNRFLTKFDSTISHIDTTVHYRYYNTSFPVTNFKSHLLEQDINIEKKRQTSVLFKKNRYYIFENDFTNDSISRDSMPILRVSNEEPSSRYKVKLNKKQRQEKDPSNIADIDTAKLNSPFVDINNYLFEKEKNELLSLYLHDTLSKDASSDYVRPRYYETYFYRNYLVSQVDFSFLNNSYQAFTGGAPYYNPGLNFLIKFGTNDLLEDYKITGGFRLASDLESGEYLLSVENLKKRKDRQLLFHRQAFNNLTSSNDYVKTLTHELMYIERYPFSQVLAIRNTITARHDRSITMATAYLPSLDEPDLNKVWLSYKSELIFDNTQTLSLNIYRGIRFKLFGEAYAKVNDLSNLFVLGADFRYYQKIHRNLIWATRIAGSTSFGSNKLVYYLGGVDNWTNIYFRREESFDQSVPVDPNAGYAFQALATNMRGFIQNIRNGNNFMVANTELRFPIIQYFMNRPLSNAFLNNFQLIGFYDMGTAWSGVSPWAGKNAYDKQVIDKVSYVVTIDSNRDPIVAGYGFGVRSQLLGYFIRLDWAWGIENLVILPSVFYLSLNLDF